MPQHKDEIRRIYKTVFKEGCYDINMLMDVEDGMTLEVRVDYFQQTPAMLSHLRRKVHDWLKDYAGLTDENIRRANKSLNAEEEVEAGDQEPLQEVSGN
jgi:Na+-translocating ferredoxin:NAD+ oxidoreductase RnfG subunit